MWTTVENLISYFDGLDFNLWDIEVNTNSGRFRYKLKTERLWDYTAEKAIVKGIVEIKNN